MVRLKEHEVLICEHRNAWKHGILNVKTLGIGWQSPLVWIGKLLSQNKNEALRWNGFSQKIGTDRITIFRHRNQLYLILHGQLIEVSERTTSELELIGTKLQFTVKQDNKIVFKQIHKQIKSIVPIENDPTPFVEAEDSDLRILIHGALTDKERQKLIFA